jgi:predicted nucleic acid-binding protein
VAKVFLDTNVIVYANDARDTVKQQRSIDLVTTSIRDAGVVSTQILEEYVVVASTKLV